MGTVLAGFVVALASVPRPADDVSLVVPAARGGPPHLFRVTPATGDAKNLTHSQAAHELFPAVSPDGAKLAFVAGGPADTRVWVANADGSGAKAVTQAEVGTRDQGPAWKPDGKRLAYARLVRPAKWELRVCNADGSDDAVVQDGGLCPAWSPDGTRIAFAAYDPDAKAGRLAAMNPDGSGVKYLTGPLGPLEMLAPAWSPDGRSVVFNAPAPTATGHGIELFRVSADGTGLRRLTHLGNACLYPVWLSDREILFTYLSRELRAHLSVRADGTRLQVHPLSKYDTPHELTRVAVAGPRAVVPPAAPAAENPVRPVAHAEPAAAKGPNLVGVGWSAGNGIELAWAPTGAGFAASAADGAVGLAAADPTGLRPTGRLAGHPQGTTAMVWAADGGRLYTIGRDKLVRAWNPQTAEALATAADEDAVGFGLAADPAGAWAATGTAAGRVTVRDPGTLKARASWELAPGRKAEAIALAAAPDGKALYAAGGSFVSPVTGGVVAAFDPVTGKELWRATGAFGGVLRTALSPDGTKLAGACVDACVHVWDTATGKELGRWAGHAERVSAVAWSPDGKWVVSGALDHTARVWDAATGTPVATIAAHLAPVLRVGFSGDGKYLATVGPDRVMVWRVE